MDNLLDRLITQLDALVPFLSLSHQNVFELIKRDHQIWLSPEDEKSLPDTYATYRRQVTHAAFLLGFSYSEAFLADLVRQIYVQNPHMLPNDKQVRFAELRTVQTYDDVMKIMIDKEVTSVFSQSMADVEHYFDKKFNLPWPRAEKSRAVVASFIRNCIIHNLAVADSRLAEVSDYQAGDHINLEPSDVHSYGLIVRALARNVFSRANSVFLSIKTA